MRGRAALRGTRSRGARAAAVLLVVIGIPVGVTAAVSGSPSLQPTVERLAGPGRATQGGQRPEIKPGAGIARAGKVQHLARSRPTVLHLRKARTVVFDVRKLKSVVRKRERPEHEPPRRAEDAADEAGGAAADTADEAATDDAEATQPTRVSASTIAKAAAAQAPAPAPDTSFDGLDYANWGAGHPPDPNGDVGPTYYVQVINTSIGIYDKSTGNRVAAFTFDALMSQGHFGNLCDTDNFGDPVVLYDSFEDRWFITDFAFKLDSSGNVNPEQVFQCFAVSKTGDPVTGGWSFYSIEAPGGLDDYPKFGVWPDGIYMSANMFDYSATGAFQSPHVWAIDKAEMYAGAPTAQVVDFAAPSSDFTLLPANARLQAGTPPAGTPEYFVSTWQYLNAIGVYKFHVDWDRVSTSTFTGPDLADASTCWPNSSVPDIPTPANELDSLEIRAMAQAQYSNIGGAESLWVDHTVLRPDIALASCGATSTGAAAVRWYQANVTGGTVAANLVQSKTWDPDESNTFDRWMPSLAVDRAGDLAVGYSLANSTTNPKIMYAGRLAGDPVDTFSQGEQTLIAGTGSQSGNCGGSTCIRWGDYSGMALDPDGCDFWETNEYYADDSLNYLTRIGSFRFPGCTTVGNGTLSGTVTDGTNPIAGATVELGSRATTTDGSGHYSFTVPAGTYPSLTASHDGYEDASVSTITVPSGGSATQSFTLDTAPQSGCLTDDSQSDFERGIPSDCDLTASPGDVDLLDAPSEDVAVDDSSSTSGFGFSSTSLLGQTFEPTVSGKLTSLEVYVFCASCSGTNPNITAQVRTTVSSGGTPVPNMAAGALLASASAAGTSDPSGFFARFTFATPPTLTAGTAYGFVVKLASDRSDGGTQAVLTTSGNPYAGGRADGCSTSACSVLNPATSLQFHTFMETGFASAGTFTSSLKDANPAPGRTPTWTTLSFTDTTPAGTSVKFQVAASNSQYGPFDYVGPDGTANTYFTTSGASLSQFDGFRYLRYKAYLSTSDDSVTPSLSSVSVCFADVGHAVADFDGDGKTDIAFFRPSVGMWHIQGEPLVHFGGSGDIPVPGDYNGDGKTDIAFFRPSVGMWHIQGEPLVHFGESGDFPLPLPWAIQSVFFGS